MKIEKIAVNGHYVWVDKDSLEAITYLFWDASFAYKIVTQDYEQNIGAGCYKIIAASPELNLRDIPTYVEWLAEQEYEEQSRSFEDSTEMFPFNDSALLKTGFIKGYQAAEKELYTEDYVRKAIAIGFDWCHQKQIPTDYMINEFIKQLKQGGNK